MTLKIKHYRHLELALLGFGLFLVFAYVGIYLVHHWQQILDLSQTSKDLSDFLQRFRSPSLLNFVVLLLLTTLSTVIPFMSSAVFAVFNGMTFGAGLGFAMTLLANILGNLLLMSILHKLPLSRKDSKVEHYLKRLDSLPYPELGLLIGYMVPIIPTILVAYRAEELSLPFGKWLALVSLGQAPMTLLYVLGGSAILKGNHSLLVSIMVLVVLILLVANILIKRGKKHGLN